MVKIVLLNTISKNQWNDTIEQIKTIFYLSSSIQNFSSEERKIAFFKKWCGDYITFFPKQFFIMREENSDKVLGYLSGCLDSQMALSCLVIPGMEVFSDAFINYPAHLHINFHPDCRGQGLGSLLVQEYCQYLSLLRIKGVHLVTSVNAANISFYHKLNFHHQIQRSFNQSELLFMGKNLD